VKRGDRQGEPIRPLGKFFVKFEPGVPFCEAYPSNWFQIDKMIGNATPFYEELVAVLKFRDDVGWRRSPGKRPLMKTFAVILIRKRDLLVARLGVVKDSIYCWRTFLVTRRGLFMC
jgi:hypothetical protein